MVVNRTHRESVEERFQFRLRSLFLFVTTVAIACALCLYSVVLLWITLGILAGLVVLLGPPLVTEFLVLGIDTSSRFLTATAGGLRRRFRR